MTAAAIRHVAVIDIGKTNAKVALVDLDRLAEIDTRRTPNAVLLDGLYGFLHQLIGVEKLVGFLIDQDIV